jgi:hypothetical protein
MNAILSQTPQSSSAIVLPSPRLAINIRPGVMSHLPFLAPQTCVIEPSTMVLSAMRNARFRRSGREARSDEHGPPPSQPKKLAPGEQRGGVVVSILT